MGTEGGRREGARAGRADDFSFGGSIVAILLPVTNSSTQKYKAHSNNATRVFVSPLQDP